MPLMLFCGGRASWLLSLALLSACAASSSRSEPRASAASAGGESAAQPGAASTNTLARETAGDAQREMTWEQYYADVEQRARRQGGVVMWLNPPRPTRRTNDAPPSGTVPTSGGVPLSSSVR